MTASDRPAFATLVMALAETFRAEATDGMITGYWLGLEDLPLADLTGGVATALRQARFMPPPAELREWAEEARARQQAAAELARRRITGPPCGACGGSGFATRTDERGYVFATRCQCVAANGDAR